MNIIVVQFVILDKNEIMRYMHTMSFYKVQVTFWQIFLFLFILVEVFITFGCNGTRFIFSAPKDIVSTPADLELDYDDIWIDTSDGVKIHGWWIPGRADNPLVVFFHGNSANISHFVELLKFINEMELSAFIFDYRGFGKSHGRLDHEEDLYIDGRGVIAFLRKKGWQPSQMIFYGHSMGAAVALQVGLEAPPAAVVLESPFTSMSDIAWHTAPVTYALIGWWAIDAEFDNLNKIKNLSVPLVILQGIEDKIVPPKMAQQLFNQAQEPKAIYLIPDGGHADLIQVGGEKYKKAWKDLVRYWVSTQTGKVGFGFY